MRTIRANQRSQRQIQIDANWRMDVLLPQRHDSGNFDVLTAIRTVVGLDTIREKRITRPDNLNEKRITRPDKLSEKRITLPDNRMLTDLLN